MPYTAFSLTSVYETEWFAEHLDSVEYEAKKSEMLDRVLASGSVSDALDTVRRLKDAGLITHSDFDTRKRQILTRL
jgi:hypothetical protein